MPPSELLVPQLPPSNLTPSDAVRPELWISCLSPHLVSLL